MIKWFFHTQKTFFCNPKGPRPGFKWARQEAPWGWGCTLAPSTMPSIEFRGAYLVFRGAYLVVSNIGCSPSICWLDGQWNDNQIQLDNIFELRREVVLKFYWFLFQKIKWLPSALCLMRMSCYIMSYVFSLTQGCVYYDRNSKLANICAKDGQWYLSSVITIWHDPLLL